MPALYLKCDVRGASDGKAEGGEAFPYCEEDESSLGAYDLPLQDALKQVRDEGSILVGYPTLHTQLTLFLEHLFVLAALVI